MTREQAADDRIREWLHDEADGQLPDWVLTTTFDRTRAQRQRRALPGWRFPMTLALRRPVTARPLRTPWALILAAILALALAGSALVLGSRLLQPVPPDNGPLAVAMPPTACPPGTMLKSGDIATIAGTGVPGRSDDGGAATSAVVAHPSAVAVDTSGAVYFTDSTAIVRRVDANGTLSAYAGHGLGDPFISPSGLAIGADGDLYVSDVSANQVFRVDPDGSITVVAGTGKHHVPSTGDVEPGDGGPAIAAELWTAGVSVDPAGAIYIDGWGRYRKIDTHGVMHAFAGTGASGWTGDGGPAIAATFGGAPPDAPAADRYGNVYLNDPANLRIRKVDPSGFITTVAGNGDARLSGDDGPATQAGIGSPTALAVDEIGNLFLATAGSIRMVDATGTIRTIAGAGGYRSGYSGDCGPAVDALFTDVGGLAVHDGIVYLTDTGNSRIRAVVL